MSRRLIFVSFAFALFGYTLFGPSVSYGQQPDVDQLIKQLDDKQAQLAQRLDALVALEELGVRAKPALPAMTRALSDREERVRWYAARALGALGAQAAVAAPALAKVLSDQSPLVRAHAARTLGLIGEASKKFAPQMAKLIADRDANVRRAVVRAFIRIRPDRSVTVPLVTKILEDAEPSVRNLALHAMAEAGKDAVDVMIVALGKERSRYWACLVLAEIGPEAKDAVPQLLDVTDDRRPEVRLEALMALGAIRPDSKQAVEKIAASLDDKITGVRYAAAFALGNIGPPAKLAGAKLMGRVRNAEEDDFLRTTCLWSLTRVYPDDERIAKMAVPLLVKSLKHPQRRNRLAAAQALSTMKADRKIVVPALVDLFDDPSPEVMANAVDALAAIGEPVVEAVQEALGNDKLRLPAVLVLARIGPKAKQAVPALVKAMDQEPRLEVRREIFFALAAIGPGSKEAIGALIKALDHENVKVQNGASYALGKIGPTAKAALPALKKNYLNSKDPLLHMISAWAMVHIAPQDADIVRITLPVFIAALKHEETLVRIEAAETLGSLGPRAKQAAAALKNAIANDKEQAVRAVAAEALKKIEPGSSSE